MAIETQAATRAPIGAVELAQDVMPVPHLLLRAARQRPDHEALVLPDARLTYAEVAERAWRIAKGLLALGVGPGDHVGSLMTNHPDLVAAFFGIQMTGATIVPINARYRTAELGTIVEDSDVVVLVTHDSADEHVDFTSLLHASLPGLAEAPDPRALSLPGFPRLRSVVMLGDKEPAGLVAREEFEALADAFDDGVATLRVEALRVRDIAIVLYTSGTTSAPRGALLTHEAFVRIWTATGRIFGTTAEDRHYTPLPLFHVAGLGNLIWIVGAGATFITDYSWNAGRALRAMEEEKATQFFPAYQPIMEDFLAHPDFPSTDLGHLRVFLNTTTPEMLEKFQARLPQAVELTMYGGTEGGPVTCTRVDDPVEVRMGTSGRCQRGLELRVVDRETGETVPAGTPGIIQFRGWNTLERYYKSPEKTAESMPGDGWVTMLDLGVLDEAGNVLFLGRAKETLKVGGENVAPQEVESHLCTHPAVKLAQVVGMDDDKLVEVPAAYVELQAGATVSPEELIEHCRGRIASFKVPRLIRFIDGDEWPMSLTKIQRFALRERLAAELDEEAKA